MDACAAIVDIAGFPAVTIRDINIAAIDQCGGSAPEDPELAVCTLQVVADELVRLRLADTAVYTTERILAQMDTAAKALLQPRRSRRWPPAGGHRVRARRRCPATVRAPGAHPAAR